MPSLYVVATPIGNLEDLTLRALRVLGEVDLVAAEDTRVTRKLLTRYEIRTPVTSYHEHNKRTKLPRLLAVLRDKDVALVSDAGMPGISDPGPELVSAATRAGIPVVSVPGASAITSAISVSGLSIDKFIYLGFLPRRRTQRLKLLESLATDERALVAFETPHRLTDALEDILATLGDRRIAVCRELTKLHEEVFHAPVSAALAHFTRPRGEFTLVIEGVDQRPGQSIDGDEEARYLLRQLRGDGFGVKEAVPRAVRELGLTRRRAYTLWLEINSQATSGDREGGDF